MYDDVMQHKAQQNKVMEGKMDMSACFESL